MAQLESSLVEREVFRQIKKHIGEADRICSAWDYENGAPDNEDVEQIQVNLEAAYEQSLFLMEKLQLPQARARIQEVYDQARKNFAESSFSPSMAEQYLVWSYRLSQLISAAEYLDTEGAKSPNPLDLVQQICDGFHRNALKLQGQRYSGRPSLVIQDEYDVQYLLETLLVGVFPDVRREEYTPGLGSVSARMDFLLKEESIVVETKMMRPSLDNKRLKTELNDDKAHYKKHPDCKVLVCFVYDPDHKLKNPHGFEKDLSEANKDFTVRVFVRPKA